MSFGNTIIPLSNLTVTTATLFPCSEGGARNEITGSNLLAGLSIVTGAGTSPDSVAWVSRVRANSIAGADGASIASFASVDSNARTFTGTGTLKTGANGINGQNVLRFNGSSNTYTTPAGGASLTGDWYAAAIVRPASTLIYQGVVSWGDSGVNGKMRDMRITNTNFVSFDGWGANFGVAATTSALVQSTPYLIEMQYVASTGVVTMWVNGIRVINSTTTSALVAYASAVLRLGANAAGSEFLNGDLAEAFWLGTGVTLGIQYGVRNLASATYGINISSNYLAVISGTTVSPSVLYQTTAGNLSVGGTLEINVGGTVNPVFTTPAALSVQGPLAADSTGLSDHMLSNTASGYNTLALWNKSPTGFSAFRALDYTGKEQGAFGCTRVSPWGSSNGDVYIEFGNVVNPTVYGQFRMMQGALSGPLGSPLTRQFWASNGSITTYDQLANVVAINGVSPASVANNGTLDTGIPTGAGKVGTVYVKDGTNSKLGMYKLENATLTDIGTNDTEFSTSAGAASKVSIYSNSGQIRLENKTGGALNLSASFAS